MLTDAGVYSCTARNKLGMISKEVTVDVEKGLQVLTITTVFVQNYVHHMTISEIILFPHNALTLTIYFVTLCNAIIYFSPCVFLQKGKTRMQYQPLSLVPILQ